MKLNKLAQVASKLKYSLQGIGITPKAAKRFSRDNLQVMYDGILELLSITTPHQPSVVGGAETFVAKSLLDGGNNGLFATLKKSNVGPIKQNNLICLYPGFYYPPPPSWMIGDSYGDDIYYKPHKFIPWQSNSPQSVYRINCTYNGGYLDALNGDTSTWPNYALGHLVNHPPKHTTPNVYPVDFSWIDLYNHLIEKHNQPPGSKAHQMLRQKVKQINRIGEGIWFVDPESLEPQYLTEDCASCCGIALLALRDIDAREELYMDYKFNPKDPVPDWYHPVRL